MSQVTVPEGCNRVMPYLIVKNAAGLMDFMKKIFGAQEQMRHLNEDGSIMHAQVQIGESIIMFGESAGPWLPQPAGMFIYVANADESYDQALAEGAASVMPPADQDYGRSCGVADPFGNTWWITSVK